MKKSGIVMDKIITMPDALSLFDYVKKNGSDDELRLIQYYCDNKYIVRKKILFTCAFSDMNTNALISRVIDYTPPNTYRTLKDMISEGVIEKRADVYLVKNKPFFLSVVKQDIVKERARYVAPKAESQKTAKIRTKYCEKLSRMTDGSAGDVGFSDGKLYSTPQMIAEGKALVNDVSFEYFLSAIVEKMFERGDYDFYEFGKRISNVAYYINTGEKIDDYKIRSFVKRHTKWFDARPEPRHPDSKLADDLNPPI